MNLEHICDREVLKREIRLQLQRRLAHPSDDIIRDSFNALQMMYNELFGTFYHFKPVLAYNERYPDLSRGNYD